MYPESIERTRPLLEMLDQIKAASPQEYSEVNEDLLNAIFGHPNPESTKTIPRPKPEPRHNADMDQISRPEMDAKLEALEARIDGRIARIEDSVRHIAESVRGIKEDNRNVKQSISSLKTVIVSSAIGAVIAIVLGIAAFNSSLTSNMMSAFQLGQQSVQTSAGSAK